MSHIQGPHRFSYRLKEEDIEGEVRKSEFTININPGGTTTNHAYACFLGRVQINTKVTGYRKHHLMTQKIFDTVDLMLPPIQYQTVGFWIDLPSNLRLEIEKQGVKTKIIENK